MKSLKTVIKQKTKLTSTILWVVAILLTLLSFTYQDKTGPTYPLEGNFTTAKGDVHYKFLRSETIGNDLTVMLIGPVPEGISAYVKYRRYNSDDEWQTLPFESLTAEVSHHGQTETIQGLGAELPSLHERAGKYESEKPASAREGVWGCAAEFDRGHR